MPYIYGIPIVILKFCKKNHQFLVLIYYRGIHYKYMLYAIVFNWKQDVILCFSLVVKNRIGDIIYFLFIYMYLNSKRIYIFELFWNIL